MTDARTLYDEDFVAWTEQQAEALRAAALGNTNQPLDWENLAEEIESLGKSDRRELHSQVYRIIRHLLKLQFSTATGPRQGWRDSVNDGRIRAELVSDDSPSLKSQLDGIVSRQTPRAIEHAISDLAAFSEMDGATEGVLRSARYPVEQVLGDWFPPPATSPPAPADSRTR